MRVLFDHQCFSIQYYGGISNCFAQLAAAMPDNVTPVFGIAESNNRHLADLNLIPDLKPATVEVSNFLSTRKYPLKFELYKWATKLLPRTTSLGRNNLCSVSMLEQGDYDIFHATLYDPYFLEHLHGKPFVITIHDMIPELYFRKECSTVRHKKLLIEKASHIIAVSEKTKEDLISLTGISDERVSVIYHGAPDIEKSDGRPVMDFPYILFVGQRDDYKNFVPMVRCIAPVLENHPEIRLVCTSKDFKPSEITLLEELGIKDRTVHITAGNAELMNLYSHALCMIFPSLYEGFGIPILESWKTGCPLLLNKRSCFPEIAGDAALWFNLDSDPSSSDLANVLEHFLSDKSVKEELLKKQEQRLSLYSWKKSAAQLADVYQKVIQSNHSCL